jgi:hypothetical protein
MSVDHFYVDFNTLEKEIYEKCLEFGREKLRDKLEKYDDALAQTRDRNTYRHKGKRKGVIKTVMGEVEYQRAVYQRKNEDGTTSCVYLLDEALGISGNGFMSGLLSRMIVEEVCSGTYRHAAQAISEMTGQSISHTAAWNVVQMIGMDVDKKEQEAAKQAQNNNGKGTAETAVLFEEQDGIMLHLQGKSREERGKSAEMKVSIAYDGAQKEGKNRYRLTGKVATAKIEPTLEFQQRKEGRIAEVYNVDEIKLRINNGDGAAWIQRGHDESTHYQLDPYHRNKAVLENVSNARARKMIMKMLYNKDIDGLLEYIDALANSVEDEKEEKKLRSLYSYYSGNKEGLVGWKQRGLDVPEPPEGKEYRNLGTMESNIFTIIGNRMKGDRACWSVNGANNLAGLLALKHADRLRGALDNIAKRILPGKYIEVIDIKLSCGRIQKQVGKGYEPPRGGSAPAMPDWKFLRGLGRLQWTII